MQPIRHVFGTCALALALYSPDAMAVPFGGIEFPQGAVSFADAVKSYDPVISIIGDPSAPHRQPESALGVPNEAGINCSLGFCGYVSLGDGGSLTVEFVDNRLTGSGTSAFDLWIFEIGSDVEDTLVEISKDGLVFTSVGTVTGATAGIDIDASGFSASDLFRFVRLTDDPELDDQNGSTVGADIDAVGAISTILAPAVDVPEPTTAAFLGLSLLLLRRCRRA